MTRAPLADRLLAILCILAAAAYLSASFSIVRDSFSDPLGARVFPQILGTLLILLSIVILVRPSPAAAPAGRTPLATCGAIALSAGIVAGFVLLLPVLGYLLTSFLTVFCLLMVLRERVVPALLHAAGLALLFYVVFSVLLQTSFPHPFGSLP